MTPLIFYKTFKTKYDYEEPYMTYYKDNIWKKTISWFTCSEKNLHKKNWNWIS